MRCAVPILDIRDRETREALMKEFFSDKEKTREKYKDYPNILAYIEDAGELFEQLSRKRRDPQETDPVLGPIIQAAGELANQTVENGVFRRGRCNLVWIEQKRLLAKQGIDWKTPAEMNPRVRFS